MEIAQPLTICNYNEVSRREKEKISINSLVSQLVRYRVRQCYSIVFVHTARSIRSTHSPDICNAQRGATRV